MSSVFLCFVLGIQWVPACIVSGWLQSPSPLLQSCVPLKPSTAAAREGWWCTTDVFTVRFQTAAFPFFRLFFLYLSNPSGRLTACSPGSGFLCENPRTGPRDGAGGSTCYPSRASAQQVAALMPREGEGQMLLRGSRSFRGTPFY